MVRPIYISKYSLRRVIVGIYRFGNAHMFVLWIFLVTE